MHATRKAIVALTGATLLVCAILLSRSTQPPAGTGHADGPAGSDQTGTLALPGRSPAKSTTPIEARTPIPDALSRDEVGAERGPIAVHVIDAITEAPVAGLVLFLHLQEDEDKDDPSSADPTAITDEDGVAQFIAQVHAFHRVRVEDPFLYFVDPPYLRPSSPRIDLRIARGGAVRGTVLSPRGAGAEGVTVKIDYRRWSGLEPEARLIPQSFRRDTITDSSGMFTLPAVPIGPKLTVEALLGTCRLVVEDVTLTEPGRTIQMAPILLPAVGAIRVVLSDPGKDPSQDRAEDRAQVRVGTGDSHWLTDIGSATGSLADGIVLDPVPVGSWTLDVIPEQGCKQLIRGVQVEAGGTTEVSVQVAPGLRLHGLLREAGGSPLSGGVTVLQDDGFRHARSASDGKFQIAGLTPGSAVVLAASLSHTFGEVTIDISETMAPIEIVLDPTPDRMLQVTKVGAPLSGSVWFHRKDNGREMERVTLDNAGRAQVGATSGDTIMACVWTPDFSYGGYVTIPPADKAPEVATVDLVPALTISGYVLHARTGRPIQDASVRVSPKDRDNAIGDHDAVATTDTEGSFALDGLLAGEHQIEITHPLFETERRTVPGPSGAVAIPAILLTPRLTVSGGVFDKKGEAVVGAFVEILGSGLEVVDRDDTKSTSYRPDPRRRFTRSDAEGAFELALPLGTRFQVTVSPPHGRTDVAVLETSLPPEVRDHHDLRFELPDARSIGGQISGTVHDRGRFSVDSVDVIPFDPRNLNSRGSATLDQAGRYEVLALKPGQYVVIARAGQEIAAASVVDVELGEDTRCDLTTGRATLIVNIVARQSGDPVPGQVFKILTTLGARTGPERGEKHRVDPVGVFRQEIASGLPYSVFVGEDNDEAKAIESFTPSAGETREITLTIDVDRG